MQEELITLQFGSFSSQVLEHWWDLEKLNTLFETQLNPDTINNSIFSNGDILKPRTLIFDLKDNLEKYNFFKINNPGPKKKETQLSMWDPSKIDVFDHSGSIKKEESKGEKSEDVKPLAYSEFDLTQKNFVRIPPPDTYFNTFVTGQYLTERGEFLEEIYDKVRHFLEESDHYGGTQVFLDVNSGYGPLVKVILDYLVDEEGKKPSIIYAIENEYYLPTEDSRLYSEMKHINKMMNYYMLNDSVSLYHPIELEQFSKFKNFNPDHIKKNPESIMKLLPLLISNISFPYRNTHYKKDLCFKNFTNTLLSFPNNKLVTSCFHIKGFPQDLTGAFSEKLDLIDPIFAYQLYQPLTTLNLTNQPNLSLYASFGEDFTLRGNLAGIKLPKPRENNYDFHLAENNILVPYEYTQLFDENILVKYAHLQEDSQKLLIESLPIHSATFSNEAFKFYFKETVNAYEKFGFNSKLQFRKDGVVREEDMKDMEHFFRDMYDRYDRETDDT